MQSGILSGWKDIANYLRKGVRTVQRYERELGLPVRRPSGKIKGSVIATQSELDAWASSCNPAEPFPVRSASVLSVCGTLRKRVAEMEELASRMRELRVELRACQEKLCATIHRIHSEADEYRRVGRLPLARRRLR